MLKKVLLCTAMIVPGMTGSMIAQQPVPGPIINYTLVFADAESRTGAVDSRVLAEIIAWLAEHFDLPASDPPRVSFVPRAQIAAFRYRGFTRPPSGTADEQAMLDAGREVAAVYDDATGTIYLPQGWSGATPAEVSLLVHETVHHLQNRAQFKYECPQAREKLAYAAQERWLRRYELSLSSEFEIDPLTLLVRTGCLG